MVVIRPSAGVAWADLVAMWKYRELLYFLIWREVKVRYKQTAIGVAWALVQPLTTMVIFTLIFGRLAGIPSDGLPYPVFAYAALLPWTYFSQAVVRSVGSLVGDANLIRKVYFPRVTIPLASVLAPSIEFVLSFGVLLGLMAWFGLVPTWRIASVPLFFLLATLSALAVGLWLSALNVRFRDVGHTIPFLLQVWLYASPVVYPVSVVPKGWRFVYQLNPMCGVIEGFRWGVLGKGGLDWSAMGVSAGVVLLVLAGGLVFFRSMERTFADVA